MSSALFGINYDELKRLAEGYQSDPEYTYCSLLDEVIDFTIPNMEEADLMYERALKDLEEAEKQIEDLKQELEELKASG